MRSSELSKMLSAAHYIQCIAVYGFYHDGLLQACTS